MSLNGVWGYSGRSEQAALAAPPTAGVPPADLVPYPRSRRCRYPAYDDKCGIATSSNLPSTWRGRYVLLHFGAVDQIATVW
jgi:hypothetical protein